MRRSAPSAITKAWMAAWPSAASSVESSRTAAASMFTPAPAARHANGPAKSIEAFIRVAVRSWRLGSDSALAVARISPPARTSNKACANSRSSTAEALQQPRRPAHASPLAVLALRSSSSLVVTTSRTSSKRLRTAHARTRQQDQAQDRRDRMSGGDFDKPATLARAVDIPTGQLVDEKAAQGFVPMVLDGPPSLIPDPIVGVRQQKLQLRDRRRAMALRDQIAQGIEKEFRCGWPAIHPTPSRLRRSRTTIFMPSRR